MKYRTVFGLMLSVLLLLTAGSGLASGPQPTEPSEAAGANASLAANTPWFNIYVDTPGNTGQYASVAIDPSSGITYVSYYDATTKSLRWARSRGGVGNCGPNNDWSCSTVDDFRDPGQYNSIAISPTSGGVGFAYYAAFDGQLKYAYYSCGPLCWWQKHTIDEGLGGVSVVGKHTSLQYSPGGIPYIAYYFERDVGDDALMLAYYVGIGGNCGLGSVAGQWQCDTIDAGEGVGQYASLTLDAAGNRHIAYYDGGNGDLWYATSNYSGAGFCGPGGTWLCYPIAASGDVGQYASLYMEGSNDFHIAYYDATNDAVYYAFNKGSGGNCGVLGSAQCSWIDDTTGDYHPLGISMVEDVNGRPIIAYQSAFNSLNVARPNSLFYGGIGVPGNCGPGYPGGHWDCETIKRVGIGIRQADFVSIDFNSAGLATIAYYGSISTSGGDLQVAYQRLRVFLPLVMKNQ
ncbi:hypothetical protein ACFLTC_02520 [Chloroflexota bacterium]